MTGLSSPSEGVIAARLRQAGLRPTRQRISLALVPVLLFSSVCSPRTDQSTTPITVPIAARMTA